MAGRIRTFFRDQPFLAGCAGCGVTTLVICAGLTALTALGGVQLVSCAGQGLDHPMQAMAEAQEAGFSFGMSRMNGEVSFSFQPLEPREVTCADLEAIIFPHLTGELETVKLESVSYSVGADGSMNSMPIDCTYSGYPGASAPVPAE
jgi:hypothetical protein